MKNEQLFDFAPQVKLVCSSEKRGLSLGKFLATGVYREESLDIVWQRSG